MNGDMANLAVGGAAGEIGVVVFASSVHDRTALRLACAAKKKGIPVIHVLDNWTNYRQRLEEDGIVVLQPDVYAVMDVLARDEAVQDGIPAELIRITGQPALAALQALSENNSPGCSRTGWLGKSGGEDKARLVFVSEPVILDQGGRESPSFRGYTEEEVLSLFCAMLQPYASSVIVGVIPHPRENAALLRDHWEHYRGELAGEVWEGEGGRELVCRADGVASILLYEAWLLNKPVLSVQPGVRGHVLRALEKREGVFFVDDRRRLAITGAAWLRCLTPGRRPVVRPELACHSEASKTIARMIQSFLSASRKEIVWGGCA